MTKTTILIGTTKGAFLLKGDPARTAWTLNGPHCAGWPINHVIGDPQTGMFWAAGGSGWYGNGVWRSSDHGETWELSRFASGDREAWIDANPEEAAEYGVHPEPPGAYTGEVDQLWSLGRAGGMLYAGAMPANLYASSDDGRSWALVEGLAIHPTRKTWAPGGAGLTLHTIVSDPGDPAKLWVGISMAGVLASEDTGQTWEQRVRRTSPPSDAHSSREIGHCVHNLVRAPGQDNDLLYQQNHEGVFRSSNGGREWEEITAGLPSEFGFPIAVHPRDPDTVWVIPLNGDSDGRYPPEASAAVWRSRDGGRSWHGLRTGLPQQNCFFTVLRQAMATDRARPAGIYFGTNTGSIFASPDEGETWHEIARHLPTVLSIEVLQAI